MTTKFLTNGFVNAFKLTNFPVHRAFLNKTIYNFSTKRKIISKPWNHISYDITSEKFLLNEFSDLKFIKKFLKNLSNDVNYVLLFLVYSDENEIKLAPRKQIVDINYLTSPELLSELVNINVRGIIEEYQFSGINKIIFRFREEYNPSPVKYIDLSSKIKKSDIKITRTENKILFSDSLLPFSFNYKDFGKILENNGNFMKFLYKDKYIIERIYCPIGDIDRYEIKVYFLDKIIYHCFDEKLKSGFKRIVDNKTLVINNNKVIQYEKKIKSNDYINSLKNDNEPSDFTKFFTYDIEAYLDENNQFVPYAVEWYTENKYKSYYLTEFTNYKEMIIKSIMDLLKKENHNCVIYIHNNRKFDAIFIINSLIHNKEIKIDPFFKKNEMISIALTLNSGLKNKAIRIVLKDSYCLLPSSLRKLGKSYEVETLKGIFPYNFPKLNNLNYIGKTPSLDNYKYQDLIDLKYEELSLDYKEKKIIFDFNLINEEHRKYFEENDLKEFKTKFPHKFYFNKEKLALLAFNSFKKENWNLKVETLFYLHGDCKSLYEILFKVRKMIYTDYHIDITTVCSNASLSFKIYLVNYFSQIPEDILNNFENYSEKEWNRLKIDYTPKIAKLKKKDYDFLAKSYYGGLVDVFKPIVNDGYYYDINAHYANQMLKNDYPVGDPIFSTDNNLDNYFGIVEAKITVPKMDFPPLPLRDKFGVKNPWGTWVGIYVSEELKDIRDNYGCTIEVYCGYKFEKAKLFHKFISHFNPIKEKFKGSAKGEIAKLTQNSLYGRWGMILLRTVTELVHQSKSDKIRKKYGIYAIKEMDEGMELITRDSLPIIDDKNIDKNINNFLKSERIDESLDANVAISSFISAYARIEYNRLKHLPGIGLIAGDTDSLITQNPLPSEEVGVELGKLKLEHKIKEGFHVSSKFYYHLTPDGREIIKARGAGDNLTKEDFLNLVDLGNVKYIKEKWYRSLKDAYVEIRNVPLNLKGGTLKRKLIIKDGKWIDTEPLNFNEITDKNELIIEKRN